MADLAWNLTEDLLKAPLGINDFDVISPGGYQGSSNPDDTASIAIINIAQELAYSKCPSQHAWLGIHLLRIVELTLKLRPLSSKEEIAILELAERRKQ